MGRFSCVCPPPAIEHISLPLQLPSQPVVHHICSHHCAHSCPPPLHNRLCHDQSASCCPKQHINCCASNGGTSFSNMQYTAPLTAPLGNQSCRPSANHMSTHSHISSRLLAAGGRNRRLLQVAQSKEMSEINVARGSQQQGTQCAVQSTTNMACETTPAMNTWQVRHISGLPN